ncbi:MAG: UvrB/UvrC motif-containing protein [Clostridia bacterium]|nr:UvrB/UvrC motif-containing protein [Clostridia bacterium]
MLCQQCGLHPATTHIRTSINGVQQEKMLCSHCAAKEGYQELSSLFTGGLLGSLLKNDLSGTTAAGAIRCTRCGISFEEIARSGKVGCGDCYQQFRTKLAPTVERLHGKADHVGKTPYAKQEPTSAPKPSRLEELKEQLARAIETQEFELAAQLRDEIREMEGTAQ